MTQFCGKCGAQMQPGARFCALCGWDASQMNPNAFNNQGMNQYDNQGYNQGFNPNFNQGMNNGQQVAGFGYQNNEPYYQQPYQQPYQQSYQQPATPPRKKKGKGCFITLLVIGLILFGVFKGLGFVAGKVREIGIDLPEINVPEINLPMGGSFSPEKMNGTWIMTVMTTSVDASQLGEEYQAMYNAYLGQEYKMTMKFALDADGNGIVSFEDKASGMAFESPTTISSDTLSFVYEDENGMYTSKYEAQITEEDGVMILDGRWETTMAEPPVTMKGKISGQKNMPGQSVTGLDFKKADKSVTAEDYYGQWEGLLRFDFKNVEDLPEMTEAERAEMMSALDVDHRCKLEVTPEAFVLTMILNINGKTMEDDMEDMPYDVVEGILAAVLSEDDLEDGQGGIEMMIVDNGSPKKLEGRVYMAMPLPNGKTAEVGMDYYLEQP